MGNIQRGSRMTTFDDREKGFEGKFAHDAELEFKATARRNKLLGLWAGELMGLEGQHLDDYAAADLLGDMGFGLAVRKISDSGVVLEAVVNQGSDYETLWKQTVAFDASGRAILPFWTHRLILTRTGKDLAVAFTPDGDGTGWPTPTSR